MAIYFSFAENANITLNLKPALVYSKDFDSQSSTLKNGKQVKKEQLQMVQFVLRIMLVTQ